MQQFDVYLNPSNTTNQDLPYLVDIQSPLHSQLHTRIVIPLARLSALGAERMHQLCPELSYEDQSLVLLTSQLAGIRAALLNQPIGSLAHQRDTILNALDFVVSGF